MSEGDLPRDDGMVTKEQLEESLERVMNNLLFEMNLRFTGVEKRFDQVDKRFDRIESRLDRQAGLIQSGARALLRMDRWADAAEQRYAELSDQVNSLESRLARLEQR